MVFIGRVFDCIQPVALEVECSIPENCLTRMRCPKCQIPEKCHHKYQSVKIQCTIWI